MPQLGQVGVQVQEHLPEVWGEREPEQGVEAIARKLKDETIVEVDGHLTCECEHMIDFTLKGWGIIRCSNCGNKYLIGIHLVKWLDEDDIASEEG